MTTPYVAAAADYLAAGWSPIPLPHKEKSPPPDNYTGVAGRDVTKQEVKAWCRAVKPARANAGNMSYAPGNIGLRLPPNVIGIDADLYDGKAGAATMAEATKRWGELPPTWQSTSRYDGSGIALYRIPEGLAWPGQVGPGVETLRWDHRYAVVAPSVHDKTGKVYAWIRPDDVRVLDEIPAVDELPYLPKAWVEGLTSGKKWQERSVEELTQQEVRDWLSARKEEACDAMRKTLSTFQRRLRLAGDEGGAHGAFTEGAWALIGDAQAGHGGVVDALAKLRKTFLEGVKERRNEGAAKAEWARAVVRGVQKVVAEGEPDMEDMCDLLGNGSSGSVGTPTGSDPTESGEATSNGSSVYDFVRDDIGNAQRLKVRVGTDARFVPSLGGWAVYESGSGLWRVDPTGGHIRREVMAMVRAMEQEAQFIEDPKAQASFLAFVRASGNIGKIKATIEVAEGLKGMHADGGLFDADPRVLAVSNGVVELGEEGAKFRAARHSDYLTHGAPTPYEPKARSADWEKFLDRVLPDSAVRHWVQTLVGYSLLGANPERILVIAKGPTSSGKTTFTESLRSSLGDLASAFNLTMLREKQEEGARADVVKALPKRFLVASEASADWFLHADVIKRLTGGESIRARLLNSNHYVDRVPAFTPWLTTNEFPTVTGADQALWRRLKAAPFLVSIPEREADPTLRERLIAPEGRAAILAWAVAGWELYCRDRLDNVPPEAASMELDARDEMSDLDAWLADCCVRDAAFEEKVAAMYAAYTSWTEINGAERGRMSMIGFAKALGARGIGKARRRANDGGDNKVNLRLGIKLKPEWARNV